MNHSLNSALNTSDATAPVGQVMTTIWTGDFTQEWTISLQENDTFHNDGQSLIFNIFRFRELVFRHQPIF